MIVGVHNVSRCSFGPLTHLALASRKHLFGLIFLFACAQNRTREVSHVFASAPPVKSRCDSNRPFMQNERGARGEPSANILPPEGPFMKRSILYTTVALAAFASGYVGSSTLASGTSLVTRVAAEVGDPCTLEDGFTSGYMVSGGINGGLICQAGGGS